MNEYDGLGIDGVILFKDTNPSSPIDRDFKLFFKVEYWYNSPEHGRCHATSSYADGDECWKNYMQIVEAMEREDKNG